MKAISSLGVRSQIFLALTQKSETINFALKINFLCQNELKIPIQLWYALINRDSSPIDLYIGK